MTDFFFFKVKICILDFLSIWKGADCIYQVSHSHKNFLVTLSD